MSCSKSLFQSFLLTASLSLLFVFNVLASQYSKSQVEPIKIGLLIAGPSALAAKQGAEMAIRKANEKGGYKGRPFQLVVRSMDGPWGTGSKEAVNLIFDERVWAIMGSHDGRNAHLVEQVSAKARIVFLSAWASDPTLSQAFVPWYFSCVPNDNQQAEALIDEIYTKRKIRKIAVISDNSYDSKLAVKSFTKKTKFAGYADPLLFSIDNFFQNFNDLLNRVNKAGVRGVILFGQPSAAWKMIQQLRSRKMNLPVFGTLSLLEGKVLTQQEIKNFDNVVLISSEHWFSLSGLVFHKEFQKLHGSQPGSVSAYAFDGMDLIIEAIKKAGLDRDKIQKSLAGLNHKGISGAIQFDTKGNRVGAPGLMAIKNGQLMAVRKD